MRGKQGVSNREHPQALRGDTEGRPALHRSRPAGERLLLRLRPGAGRGEAGGREKGGRGKAAAARAEKLGPAVLHPVLDTLFAAVEEVRDGTITTQQARALSSLAGAIVRVYQVGTLEERIAALEQAQEQQQQRRAG